MHKKGGNEMTAKLPKITVSGALLQVAAFDCALGRVAKQTIDLEPQAGQTVRIWLDADRRYSTDARANHYWQVAELTVPERQYIDAETTDADGLTQIAHDPVPLDLSAVAIATWGLPA
jgi:hypothetical protein